MNRRHRLGRTAVAVLLIVIAAGAFGPTADAHTPHDDVSDVEVSPNYAHDAKVFAIVASRLLVSTDGPYGFTPLVRGLPRPPEAGGSLARIAISSSDPGVMYVSSHIGGVFRSADGGLSWHAATGPLGPRSVGPLAVAPRLSDVVLAGGAISGLYRTTNGGRSWAAVPGYGRVPAIAFVAGTGRAVVGDGEGRVSISDNNGATWTVVARSGGGSVSSIAASSGAAPATVFAGTSQGRVLRSHDGGNTFTPVGTGLPEESIQSIAVSPDYSHDHTVWVSAYLSGVYRSTDGGDTWTRTSNGLTTDPQAYVVHVAEFRALAAAKGANGATVLFAGGFDSLFRSDDKGTRWWRVETLADYITGLAISPNYAQDSTVAVATYVKGAYFSANAGKTWSRIDAGLQLRHVAEGNKFAPIWRLHNVVFSPDYAHDHTIFSATWVDFLKSTNAGLSWHIIAVAPPSHQTVLRQFVIGVSPRYASDRTIFLGTRQGDIFRSGKAGQKGSWQHVANVGSQVRSIVFDPAFPTNPVLYAGTVAGVQKSNDLGKTWARTGPAGVAQLAISPNYDTDGTVFAGSFHGLFVTRDKGHTWNELTTSPLSATSTVEALAVSPDYKNDHMLLVSVGGEGLYKSTDGGTSFTAVGSDITDANHIIADFTNPTGTPIQFSQTFARDHTVFAYSGQDVLRSTDRGASWHVIQLPSALDFLRAVDPVLLTRYDPATSSTHHSADHTPVVLAAALAALALIIGGGYMFDRRRRSGTPPQPDPAPQG